MNPGKSVPEPVGFDMDREPRTMDQHCQRMASVWAKAYDAGEDRWSHTAASRSTSAVVIASLDPVSRVLDVGTGRGIDAVRYAAEGHTVTRIGLVALPEWVGIERRWPSVRFEQGALADHVTYEPYDVIVDAGCFHHQHPADLDRHLAHIRRLLRPVGTRGWPPSRPARPMTPTRLTWPSRRPTGHSRSPSPRWRSERGWLEPASRS